MEFGRTAKIAIGAVIFLGFFHACLAAVDPDLWWHMRAGIWALQHGSPPRFDEWSYTMPGRSWVDHEWLIGVVFWLLYSRGLWIFAVSAFAFFASLPFFFWLRRFRSWIYVPLPLLAAAALMPLISVRPQILSFLLFFAVFAILDSYYGEGAGRKSLVLFAALPLIFLFWANLHAGFVSGLLLFLIFMVADMLAPPSGEKMPKKKRFLAGLLVFAASVAATFLNAYGAGLYAEILRVAASSQTMQYVAEWRSPVFYPDFATGALLGIFLFFTFKYRKELPLRHLLAGAFFLALFLKSFRMLPMFLAAAMPIFDGCLSAARSEIASAWAKVPVRAQLIRNARIFAALASAAAASVFVYKAVAAAPPKFPAAAASVLRSEAASGEKIRIFNGYDWGGYLIFNVPEIKVFIDGRMPHWADAGGNSAMKDYIETVYPSSPDSWRAVFKKWGVNTALIKKTPAQADAAVFGNGWAGYFSGALARILIRTPLANIVDANGAADLYSELIRHNWKEVFADDNSVLLRCSSDCY